MIPTKPICDIHNVECVWKEGFSKTKTDQYGNAKSYAFWACPIKNPDGTYCKFDPKPQPRTAPNAPQAQPQRPTLQNIPSNPPSESVAVLRRIEGILQAMFTIMDRKEEEFVNQKFGITGTAPKEDVEIPVIEEL